MKHRFILFFIFNLSFGFTQTTSVVARKIQRFENTQRDINRVVNLKLESKDSIFQFVENKRLELAPTCPLRIFYIQIIDNRSSLIENWYLNFPLEYKNYVEFLEKFIRSNI